VTEEGERRRAGVRWSGHARLWRRRGNVHSPHAAHRPGFPAEGAYPETYGTGGESRSGMQGRWVWWCLRIVGGGIDRLSSFLVASGWKLGRGGSYGCTADPPCPRFACESLSSSSLAARRPPHQIRIWRGPTPPNLRQGRFDPRQMHEKVLILLRSISMSRALPRAVSFSGGGHLLVYHLGVLQRCS